MLPWLRLPNYLKQPGSDITAGGEQRVQMWQSRLAQELNPGSNQPKSRMDTGDIWTEQQLYPIKRANEAGQPEASTGGNIANPSGGIV